MTDRYTKFVSSGPGKAIAKQLGLPRPTRLRRFSPGDPLVTGPVLVISDGASTADADALASALLSLDLDVRRRADAIGEGRWGAAILVATELPRPVDLPAIELGAAAKRLVPSGRVVIIGRPPAEADSREAAAARNGLDGFMRSVAKELINGSTANSLVVSGGVGVTAPSVLGTLRYLLSGKSAFVTGQPIAVTSEGEASDDAERPLAGKVAVVTGAARGIGAEIVRVLARDGATVVGVDVPPAGGSLAEVINEVGGSALQLDVTAPDAGERIAEHARRRHGRLDIVVHNAGILRDKLLVNMSQDKWDDLMAVNIAAPLAMNDHFLELATAGELGESPRIVSLASTSGIAGNRGQTNYAMAKAGIIGMTRTLAEEIAEAGGTANAVAPGFIETDMTAKIPPIAREIFRRVNSLKQGGQPRDVAEAIAFLCSPETGGINGGTLRVCGQNLVGQ